MSLRRSYVKVFTRIVDYFTVIIIVCLDPDRPYPIILSHFALCDDIEIDDHNWINIFPNDYDLEDVKKVIGQKGGFYFNDKFIGK